jgi:hypothetical protein
LTQIYGDGSGLGDDRGIWSNSAQSDAGRIDMGPFLRQEGRIPSHKPPSSEAALRIKLGLSSSLMMRRHVSAIRLALQPVPRLALWASWLAHKVRGPL